MKQFESRRKQIIRNVNSKYRQKAHKEINYELSKMGDRTYLKLKNKSRQKIGNRSNGKVKLEDSRSDLHV